MADDNKLTKKQLKAQNFRKSKEEKTEEKKRPLEPESTEPAAGPAEPAVKKRKTRRGKGGKGKADGNGNRFLVFVGSLPKGITESELQAHFKTSSPDVIRLRPDKNIAFLEFDGKKDPSTIQRRMDIALLQHGTQLKGKKINVELTVGGGGNSQQRLEKLRQKNDKLSEERSTRMKAMIQESRAKKTSTEDESRVAKGVHPDRAKLLQ
ncbi:AaceriABL142Cp [[Ashbya] aceris (nom. inval.)]|nr:AaceriABL142Cp [[Ashbya] aceris (nom. inval.)]